MENRESFLAFPAGAPDFSLLESVQIYCTTHPDTLPVDTSSSKSHLSSERNTSFFVIKQYRFVDSFPAGLESCLQTCVTYTIAECTVNKLLTMYRRTVRNM